MRLEALVPSRDSRATHAFTLMELLPPWDQQEQRAGSVCKEDAVLLPQASLVLEWIGWALEKQWSVKNRPWRVPQKSPVHPSEPVNRNNPLWSWLLDGQGLWLAASLGWLGRLSWCSGWDASLL